MSEKLKFDFGIFFNLKSKERRYELILTVNVVSLT